MSSFTKANTNKISTPVARNTTVSPETIQVYADFHDQVEKRKLSKDEVETVKNPLFNEKTSQDKKKELLFRLAHTTLPEAYCVLRDFYFESAGFIQEWTALCLEECQMFLESELFEIDSDDERVMISSAGGGDGKRLRFWVVLSTKNNETKFDKKSREQLTQNVNQHFAEYDSIVEKIDWHDNYLLLTALQSFDDAIDELIVPIVESDSDLLRFHYLVVNTGCPTNEEVEEYLSEAVEI